MRTQTSKAKSQQLNTHQKNLETEPIQVEPERETSFGEHAAEKAGIEGLLALSRKRGRNLQRNGFLKNFWSY
jgi:hypothetical protein